MKNLVLKVLIALALVVIPVGNITDSADIQPTGLPDYRHG